MPTLRIHVFKMATGSVPQKRKHTVITLTTKLMYCYVTYFHIDDKGECERTCVYVLHKYEAHPNRFR